MEEITEFLKYDHETNLHYLFRGLHEIDDLLSEVIYDDYPKELQSGLLLEISKRVSACMNALTQHNLDLQIKDVNVDWSCRNERIQGIVKKGNPE